MQDGKRQYVGKPLCTRWPLHWPRTMQGGMMAGLSSVRHCVTKSNAPERRARLSSKAGWIGVAPAREAKSTTRAAPLVMYR